MKRSFTRIFCALLSCLLLVGLLAGGVVAMAEDATTGQCGQNLTWRYDPETGVLTIEGEGNMWDYDSLKLMPWFQYAGNIKKIVLSNGVTSIGKNAFACCAVEEVEFPETLKTIGEKAFYECEKLTKVDLSKTQLTTVAQKAFAECKELKTEEVKLPETAKSVAANAFEKAVVKPVQAPAPVQPPVEAPAEAPQEPAVVKTWEEDYGEDGKLVLSRWTNGTVTTVRYMKDGSEMYRSVRTYGADGKVHEEYKHTNGLYEVEDRIEDKDGIPIKSNSLIYDKDNQPILKTTYDRHFVDLDFYLKFQFGDMKDEYTEEDPVTGKLLRKETSTIRVSNGSQTLTNTEYTEYNDDGSSEWGQIFYSPNGNITSEESKHTNANGQYTGTSKTYDGNTGAEISSSVTTFDGKKVTKESKGTDPDTGKGYTEIQTTEPQDGDNDKITVVKTLSDGSRTETTSIKNHSGGTLEKSEKTYGADGNLISEFEGKRTQNSDGDYTFSSTEKFADGKVKKTEKQLAAGTDFAVSTTVTTTEGNKETIETYGPGGNTLNTKTVKVTEENGDYSVTTYKPDGTTVDKIEYFDKDNKPKQQDENSEDELTTLEELGEEKSVDDGFLLEDRDLDDGISDGMDSEDGTPVADGSDKNLNHDDEISDGMDNEDGAPVADGSDKDLNHDDDISDGMDSENGTPVADGSDKDLNHDDEISDGMDSEEGAPVADGSDGKASNAENSDVKASSEKNADVKALSTESTNKGNPTAGDSTTQVTPAPAADTQAAPAPAANPQTGAATTQVTSSQKESDKKDTDKKKDKKKKKNGEEDLLDEETSTEAVVAKKEIA